MAFDKLKGLKFQDILASARKECGEPKASVTVVHSLARIRTRQPLNVISRHFNMGKKRSLEKLLSAKTCYLLLAA